MSGDTGPGGGRRQAVKTTIVGGQPPGNERALPAIPVGLEHVLALAAAHPEFREALGRDPGAALTAASLELTPTEEAILKATPDPALALMIQRVEAGLSQPDRRQFLERASAAVALMVGGQALLGCGDKKQGAARERPRDPVMVKGIRPDRAHHGSMGMRGDYPMDGPTDHMDSMERPAPTRPGAADTRDTEPMDADAMDAAVRPRPMRKRPTRGSRPGRRPGLRMSKGIRPDRPRYSPRSKSPPKE